MSTRQPKARGVLLALLLATMLELPAFGASTVIGVVVGGGNATLGGVAIPPNTALYSGDSLQVQDGVAIVSTDRSGSLTFGRDTQASFLRESDRVTVVLVGGSVSIQHPADSSPLSIKAGDLLIAPSQGLGTKAEFSRAGGTLVVTTKEGACRVSARSQTVEIGKGQTAALRASAAPGAVGAANDIVVKIGATPARGADSVAAFLGHGGSNSLTNPANAANLRTGAESDVAAAFARMYQDGDLQGFTRDRGCERKPSESEPRRERCKCKDKDDRYDDGHCRKPPEEPRGPHH